VFKKLFANCLLVDDFERSLEFYTMVLGLEINSQEGKFANFKLEGTELAIFQKDEATAMFPEKYMGKGGGVILAIQTGDVGRFCEELKNKGVEIIEGPKETPWGQVVAYFLDPDNNIWEVSKK
jgi:lactoylglutathione lyase